MYEIELNKDSEYDAIEEYEIEPSTESTETEVVFPQQSTGYVTGVKLTTKIQIKRRERKWRQFSSDIHIIPVSATNTEVSTDRDIVSYAKRCLVDMKYSGELVTIDIDQLLSRMEHLNDNDGNHHQLKALKRGWAQRPPWGKMYGARYIRIYQQDIKELFERGENKGGFKFGPGRMLEELISRYPGKYNLPTENEIKTEISKLTQATRKRKHNTISTKNPILQFHQNNVSEWMIHMPNSYRI